MVGVVQTVESRSRAEKSCQRDCGIRGYKRDERARYMMSEDEMVVPAREQDENCLAVGGRNYPRQCVWL